MACGATLTFKRSLEFEPFHGQPSKRRCLSTAHSSAVGFGSPVKQSQPKPSVFSNAAPKITSGLYHDCISITEIDKALKTIHWRLASGIQTCQNSVVA